MSLPLKVPIRPDPDQARDWLGRELSRAEYGRHTSLFEAWLSRMLQRLFDRSSGSVPVGTPQVVGAAVVALLLVALLVGISRLRITPRQRHSEHDAPLGLDPSRSAADYRDEAERLLAAGHTDEAMVAAFRSLVVDLDRRTVLVNRPGRTAREVSATMAGAFPSLGAPIAEASRWFDHAAYAVHREARQVPSTAVRETLALGRQLASTRPDFASEAAVAGTAPQGYL